jgi:hypothetical protein
MGRTIYWTVERAREVTEAVRALELEDDPLRVAGTTLANLAARAEYAAERADARAEGRLASALRALAVAAKLRTARRLEAERERGWRGYARP